MGATGPDGDEDLDALRRRLSAPNATDADREAYLAAESAAHPDIGAGTASVSPRRLRLGVLGTATALVVGCAVLVAIGLPIAHVAVAPTPSMPAGTLAVPAGVRAGFLRDLGAGADPGLLAYLDGHPAALPAVRAAAGRTGFTGSGPTSLPLPPTTAAERAGQVTVVLLTDRDTAYDWRATKVAVRNDRSGPDPAVATREGRSERGIPVDGTVAYGGGAPTSLTLLVPNGTRWAVVVDIG